MISSWVSLIFKLNWTFSISVTSHLVLTLSILCRWISSNHFPLSNLHESLIFLAWIFSLLCVFEYKTFVPLLVTQRVSTKHLGPASLRDSGPPDQLGKHLETVSRPVGSSVSEGNTERSPVPLDGRGALCAGNNWHQCFARRPSSPGGPFVGSEAARVGENLK